MKIWLPKLQNIGKSVKPLPAACVLQLGLLVFLMSSCNLHHTSIVEMSVLLVILT